MDMEYCLRGRDTRMCCIRLTSAYHSKFYVLQNTRGPVGLKFRVN